MGHAVEWTEKYRPKSLADVVGNPKAKEQLIKWAESWKGGKPKKKGIILAGPPGIGKTTMALALANDFGWLPMEMNASDARNRDKIQQIAVRGSLYETFTSSGEYIRRTEGRLKLIILDEADNLYERVESESHAQSREVSDRGGKAAILSLLHLTKHPVILIVNDYYALTKGTTGQKIASACAVVKLRRVSKRDTTHALTAIAAKEGLHLEKNVLNEIADNANGDVRGAVNDLQAIVMGLWDGTTPLPQLRINYEDVLSLRFKRDQTPDIFHALGTIYHTENAQRAKTATMNLEEDPEMLLLWIAENLPKQYDDLSDVAAGYEYVSRADTFLGRAKRTRHFTLWKYAIDMMSSGVAVAKHRKYGGWRPMNYPTWIRLMSSQKGERRAAHENLNRLARRYHLSTSKFREHVLPYLRALLTKLDLKAKVDYVNTHGLEPEDLAVLMGLDPGDAAIKEVFEGQKALAMRSQEVEGYENGEDGNGDEGSKDENGEGNGGENGDGGEASEDGKPVKSKSLFDF